VKHDVLVKVFDKKHLLIDLAAVVFLQKCPVVAWKRKTYFLLESGYCGFFVLSLGSNVNHDFLFLITDFLTGVVALFYLIIERAP
jgi:hypothetical protein